MASPLIEPPEGLRPKWSDTPRPAWVLSRAMSPFQRRGLYGDILGIPMAAVAGLPIVLAATLTRRATTGSKRDALLIA